MQQVTRNLVGNALKYGAPGTPVRVALRAEDTGARLEVTNIGPPIDAATVAGLFEPLRRGAQGGNGDESGSLGLGLFIVREIARAHGGEVGLRCDGGEVTFALSLPRH